MDQRVIELANRGGGYKRGWSNHFRMFSSNSIKNALLTPTLFHPIKDHEPLLAKFALIIDTWCILYSLYYEI